MQQFVIQYSKEKEFIEVKDILDEVSEEYTCFKYISGNYCAFILENKNNTMYDITKRAYLETEALGGKFYYEKGYVKKYNESLTFDVSNKIDLFYEDLEKLDGNFLQLKIENEILTIRRNTMSMIPSFYAKDGEDYFFSSNANLIKKIVNDSENDKVFPYEIASTFCLWTFENQMKKMRIHNPTTNLIFDGKKVVEEDVDIFNNQEITKTEVAFRMESLMNDLVNITKISNIKLDITAGNDSRLSAALLSTVDTKDITVTVSSSGLPSAIDRKIGKYISEYLHYDIPDVRHPSTSNDKRDFKKAYFTRKYAYNLITYGGANTYQNPKTDKFSNSLYLTGHFGNVVSISDEKVSLDQIIVRALPNKGILKKDVQNEMINNIKEKINEDFPGKEIFNNKEYIKIFLKYQKHNCINQIVGEGKFLRFSPFALDIFLNLYSASTKEEKLSNKLHRDIGELLNYELYNEIPFEADKGFERINNTYYLPVENSRYFNSTAHDVQQQYYLDNLDIIKNYFEENRIYLEKYLDISSLDKFLSSEITRAKYFTIKNIIGYLMVSEEKLLPEEFYYPSISTKVETPAVLEERFVQSKLADDIKCQNLKDTYYNIEPIIFEFKVEDQVEKIVCNLKNNKLSSNGVRVSKNRYLFTFLETKKSQHEILEVVADGKVVLTKKLYIKRIDKVVLNEVEVRVEADDLVFYNFTGQEKHFTISSSEGIKQVTVKKITRVSRKKVCEFIINNLDGYDYKLNIDTNGNVAAEELF